MNGKWNRTHQDTWFDAYNKREEQEQQQNNFVNMVQFHWMNCRKRRVCSSFKSKENHSIHWHKCAYTHIQVRAYVCMWSMK